jgi:hypothetical protein
LLGRRGIFGTFVAPELGCLSSFLYILQGCFIFVNGHFRYQWKNAILTLRIVSILAGLIRLHTKEKELDENADGK